MILSIIVAVGDNRSIGWKGEMAWDIPSEYQHFLRTVSGHFILMGRVNWESNVGNSPLLSRVRSLVVSTSQNAKNFLPVDMPFDVNFFKNIQSAIDFAQKQGESELFIIGGQKIYEQLLDQVDRIYYSKVKYSGKADTFFPEIDYKKFKIVQNEKHTQWEFSLLEKE